MKTEVVKRCVKELIKQGYLPLGDVRVLSNTVLSKECVDVDYIKSRALEVLTVESFDTELLRQATYYFFVGLLMHPEDLYVLGYMRAKFFSEHVPVYELLTEIRTGFSKPRVRKAVKRLVGELVLYNFAYKPPVNSVLGFTLLTTTLFEKVPCFDVDCMFNVDEAKNIIDFVFEFRKKILETVIENPPPTITQKLIEETENEITSQRLPKTMKAFVPYAVYTELATVKHYLTYYLS